MKIVTITLISFYALYNLFIAPLPAKAQSEIKPEVALYLEGQKLENSAHTREAAQKYQSALALNPTFVLAQRKLNHLAPQILLDHRKTLSIEPGLSKKPATTDSKAIRSPIWIKDMMPGYLMVYRHPKIGEYALFSLKSRHMHNVHYLFVKEDNSWQQYPSTTLPGVSRLNDILVYHQPGETLQEGFINILINAFVSNNAP